MHISIATEQITVQKIPTKLLSNAPQNLYFSLPMAMPCQMSVSHLYHFYMAVPPPGSRGQKNDTNWDYSTVERGAPHISSLEDLKTVVGIFVNPGQLAVFPTRPSFFRSIRLTSVVDSSSSDPGRPMS